MFKLVYQSFILYALSSSYILFRFWDVIKHKLFKFTLYSCYFFLLAFVLSYPYFAINSYYQDLKIYKGLYGLNFLKENYPDDYLGIIWLNNNIKKQSVILEAAGDSYTNFNRVSVFSGLATVEGWLVHEWLWRGGFEEPGKRASEVETIFTSKDQFLTISLLKKYKVEYIFIGTNEHEKYQINESKFKEMGKVVFQSGSTKIYFLDKLNNP